MGYRVSKIEYNTTYKVIGKHPDGRIFAVKFSGQPGLYVVDRNLNLISTLSTTLFNNNENDRSLGINECVILKSGTMICWGIYQTNPTQTKIYRSTDTTYSTFEEVFSLPMDICFIEKSVGVSTLDDTIMCCEYTMVKTDSNTGLWLPPLQLNIWRGTNDGRDWDIVATRKRNPSYVGDMERIRHFHGVRYDPYENLFWICSGDMVAECAIYTIKPNGSDFTVVAQDPLSENGQRLRTTSFMFTEDYVWWGSDSIIDNPMGRLNRTTREIEALFQPNDCIRVSDKMNNPSGTYLIANKSYEKTPSNPGTTELLVCDDFITGEWYALYSWEVADLSQVAVYFQIIDNQDGRIFVHARNIKSNDGASMRFATAIIDVTKSGESKFTISPQGKMVKVGVTVQYRAIDTDGKNITKEVKWRTNNPDVITISDEGVAVILGVGVAEISATDNSGTEKKAYITVMSNNATNTMALQIHVGSGSLLSVPIYDTNLVESYEDTRWRFKVPQGVKCFKLVNSNFTDAIPTIKVKIEGSTKEVKLFE